MNRFPTFDPGFSTPEMTAVFEPARRIKAMLAFEAALADAEAEAGVVDTEVAAEIGRACARFDRDPEAIVASTWESGTPIIALLGGIKGQLEPASAKWVHYGATSQDVIDTALMLQLKDGADLLHQNLTGVARQLAGLADKHRANPMIGRTFLQHAEPTTFGVLAAHWLSQLGRSVVELGNTAAGYPVQLGGPVGNLAALGEHGPVVVRGLATRLGLATPLISWHTDRSPVISAVNAVMSVAGATAKIANDLAVLAQTEVAEVRMRAGASSSMAHKANPIDALRAMAAAEACIVVGSGVQTARGHELDRGISGWYLEWWAVPQVFQTAAASTAAITTCLESLEVDTARMGERTGALDPATAAVANNLVDRVLDSMRGLL